MKVAAQPATAQPTGMRQVLRALRPIVNGNAAQHTVRGQYKAGASSGGAVKGYLEELGNDESQTETFVAIKAELDNWRARAAAQAAGGTTEAYEDARATVAVPMRAASAATRSRSLIIIDSSKFSRKLR